ncbi:MAG: nucleotidyltransferase family protein [Lachnospiraceae bacterium]|nr:nucleotidyltransferase family protein [Lachnospiraceae bacterium]
MKTIGIIAEYNPFHRGHAHQIQTVRNMTNADCIVVVMSGNFVQRGAPAWTDKYLRTQMALEGGADIVMELPAVYATASAEHFAMGGVSLLHQLGFVDALCFGSECDDLSVLSKIADFLSTPDDDYQKELTAALRTGLSYPAARESILKKRFPDILQKEPSLLASPNTILGIEYLKALKIRNSEITPIPILRTDGGYHATKESAGFLSASGIRKAFADAFKEKSIAYENTSLKSSLTVNHIPNDVTTRGKLSEKYIQDTLDALRECVPKYVQQILTENTSRFPITEDDFSSMIYYRLRTATEEELLSVSDMTPELCHRITKELSYFTNISDFITRIKTKAFTYSRISRVLFHILLNIKTEYVNTPPLYANLLGFQRTASSLLRNVTEIPVITKAADADSLLNVFHEENHAVTIEKENNMDTLPSIQAQGNKFMLARKHWQTDILADDLYREIVWQKYGSSLPDAFHTSPIIKE